jgi:hypothetical protein
LRVRVLSRLKKDPIEKPNAPVKCEDPKPKDRQASKMAKALGGNPRAFMVAGAGFEPTTFGL